MRDSSYDKTEIRKYLLGSLGQSLTEKIDERLLSDEEFMSRVERERQQLIEDGLNGKLNRSDEESFENYFPQAKEGREIDAMLRHYYGSPVQKFRFYLWSHARLCCEMAAVILLAVPGLFYLRHVHQQEVITAAMNQKLQAELAQERQLHSTVSLTLNTELLLGPGSPQVEVTDATEQIRIEIAAVGIPPETRRISLVNQNGIQIWSLVLPPEAPLRFDIPSSAVSRGFYDIVVSWDGAYKKFFFRVVR